MKLEEGPLFSALIIGVGIGFLVFQKFDNIVYGIGAGLVVGGLDYVMLAWVNKIRKKK